MKANYNKKKSRLSQKEKYVLQKIIESKMMKFNPIKNNPNYFDLDNKNNKV